MTNSERLLGVLAPVFGTLEPQIDAEAIERLSEAIGRLTDENFVCAMVASADVEQEFLGAEGIKGAWGDWLEPYWELHFRIGEFRDIGENVLMQALQVGITRHGGVEVEQPSAAVWKFRGANLYRVEFHLDPRAAERSASEL